jgi:hypothetical protein
MRKEQKNILLDKNKGNMNFHIFVAITTFVFYVFLRIYKSSVTLNQKKNKTSSNLLYVLFLPTILYLTRLMFYNKDNELVGEPMNLPSKIKDTGISEDLLSIPYPESSFRSSNLN